jgi:CO dehydrogenase maturation factor
MTKAQFLEYKIQSGLIETPRFDLLAMGRPEGPGCYCYANNLLRDILETLSANYRYVVIDNEAGMEHLSRRTTRDVEHLLIVSDPTQRGIVAAERISDLRKQLDINIKNAYLILNRLNGPIPAALQQRLDQLDVPLLGIVPANEDLMEFEFSGRPLVDLGIESPVYQAVEQMMIKML